MTSEDTATPGELKPEDVPAKFLTPAARRALAEAEERRKSAKQTQLPTEIGGRKGPEPSRFGDWEIDGRAIDF